MRQCANQPQFIERPPVHGVPLHVTAGARGNNSSLLRARPLAESNMIVSHCSHLCSYCTITYVHEKNPPVFIFHTFENHYAQSAIHDAARTEHTASFSRRPRHGSVKFVMSKSVCLFTTTAGFTGRILPLKQESDGCFYQQ